MKFSQIIKLNNSLAGQVPGNEYKIAILSNITVHQSKDICEYLLRYGSLNATVTLGDYDNIVRDAMKFQTSDAVILFWEACNFIDGLHFKIDLLSEKDFNLIVNKVKLEIDIVLAALKETPTVIINKFSSLIFDQFKLSEGNLKRLVNILNIHLENAVKENTRLFNVDSVIARISSASSTDLRYYSSSKSLYSIDFYKEYFETIKHILFAANGQAKKALIFDCDNTLWKGTLGEDGFNGIKVFQEIQFLALRLAKKGVIIGLCSKNNPEDVDYVLEHHPDMVLTDNDIVIKKVNWDNKVLNLKSIAQDLDIGLDSLVFIDDSSFEVGLVEKELSDVTVFQTPKKEYEYGILMEKVANFFYLPSETNEDLLKVKMYKDQAKRLEKKNVAINIDDYLASLDITITVQVDSLKHLSRISQLTQKTNQFNLTTKRYSETAIKKFILDDNKIVISIAVDDKYGPSGVTALVILCKKDSKIDTFLLSCRILGRNIEYKIFDIIVELSKQNRMGSLNAEFIKTLKNQQVQDFYSLCGFTKISENDTSNQYLLKLSSYEISKIKYIKVNYGS